MAETVDLSGWFFATENYNDDLQADIVLLRVATSLFSETKHEEILSVYEGTHSRIYMVREESKRVSEELIRRFLADGNWRRNLYPEILAASEKLEALYGDDGPAIESLATEKLLALYVAQNQAREELLRVEWPVEEMHSSVNSIENRLLDLVGGDKQAYADLLFTPELSAFSRERKLFREGADPVKLWEKYRYSGYHGYTNPHVKTLEEYLEEAPGKRWEPDTEAPGRYEAACRRFSAETLDIFRCYANLGVAKSYRRLAELKNFFFLDRMIRELASRAEVPEKAIRFMTPEEVLSLFGSGPAENMTPEEVLSLFGSGPAEKAPRGPGVFDPERCLSMVYHSKSGRERILTGEACRRIIRSLPEDGNAESVSGMIACRGMARGRAVVIRSAGEDEGFRPGDILVSNEPNPELFELMRTAAAVVTDQGGITCHAASIARELGIPCVTGTQNATKRIRTGDTVLVDANKGEVTVEKRGVPPEEPR